MHEMLSKKLLENFIFNKNLYIKSKNDIILKKMKEEIKCQRK